MATVFRPDTSPGVLAGNLETQVPKSTKSLLRMGDALVRTGDYLAEQSRRQVETDKRLFRSEIKTKYLALVSSIETQVVSENPSKPSQWYNLAVTSLADQREKLLGGSEDKELILSLDRIDLEFRNSIQKLTAIAIPKLQSENWLVYIEKQKVAYTKAVASGNLKRAAQIEKDVQEEYKFFNEPFSTMPKGVLRRGLADFTNDAAVGDFFHAVNAADTKVKLKTILNDPKMFDGMSFPVMEKLKARLIGWIKGFDDSKKRELRSQNANINASMRAMDAGFKTGQTITEAQLLEVSTKIEAFGELFGRGHSQYEAMSASLSALRHARVYLPDLYKAAKVEDPSKSLVENSEDQAKLMRNWATNALGALKVPAVDYMNEAERLAKSIRVKYERNKKRIDLATVSALNLKQEKAIGTLNNVYRNILTAVRAGENVEGSMRNLETELSAFKAIDGDALVFEMPEAKLKMALDMQKFFLTLYSKDSLVAVTSALAAYGTENADQKYRTEFESMYGTDSRYQFEKLELYFAARNIEKGMSSVRLEIRQKLIDALYERPVELPAQGHPGAPDHVPERTVSLIQSVVQSGWKGIELLIESANIYGAVPSKTKQIIDAMLGSKNDDDVISAARFLSETNDLTGYASIQGLSKGKEAVVALFNYMQSRGVPRSEQAPQIRQLLNPQSDAPPNVVFGSQISLVAARMAVLGMEGWGNAIGGQAAEFAGAVYGILTGPFSTPNAEDQDLRQRSSVLDSIAQAYMDIYNSIDPDGFPKDFPLKSLFANVWLVDDRDALRAEVAMGRLKKQFGVSYLFGSRVHPLLGLGGVYSRQGEVRKFPPEKFYQAYDFFPKDWIEQQAYADLMDNYARWYPGSKDEAQIVFDDAKKNGGFDFYAVSGLHTGKPRYILIIKHKLGQYTLADWFPDPDAYAKDIRWKADIDQRRADWLKNNPQMFSYDPEKDPESYDWRMVTGS